MKNTVIIFALLLAIIGSSDVVFGVETTLFGPKQYIRVSGSPDSYTGTFKAIPGLGTITVRNGRSDGEKRVEDSVSSASIKVNGTEMFGPSDFNKNAYLLSSILELYRENTLSVTLASALDSYITIEITEDLSPPAVSLSADPETTISGRGIILQWDSEEADTVIIEPDVGLVEAHGDTTVFPVEDTTYTITAIGLGGTAAQSVDVKVTSASGPTVSMRIEPSVIEPGEPAILKWSSTGAENLSIDNAIGDVLPEGSITVYPEHSTVYRLTASGASGSSGAQARIMVTAMPELQPEGSFGKQYQDMVPVDATLPAYNPEQFSLITGIVQDVAENPLEDVTVTILDHPQYGTAYTGLDGRYSIPVEGGGNITIVLRKQDYIEVQRRMPVPWNDVAVVGGVSMIKADPAYTVVKFDGNPHTILRHQSSRISDHSGTRACTLVMMGDNRAFSVDSHGNDVQELGTITVRATEYTTLKSMPAELPPNSAYTYCAEFSVDGARNVRFEKPVITWVDNFLGFDVGEIIPAGFYNRDRGVWIPVDNGIVVMLLDTDGDGITDALDADGDGQADDLNRDGLLADEIAGLQDAEQYPPGSTFWRMSLTHFSPGDFNLPAGTPRDAERPNASSIMTADRQLPGAEDCKRSSGSFVEERSRIIHEDIPVPGTGLKLYYTSNRVNGYKTMVSVPASGATVPQSLKRIVVSLNIAGNLQTREFDPEPELSAEFYWDGTDYLGQALSTPVIAHAGVGFVYDAVYYRAGLFDRAFAQPGIEATEISARQEIVLWKQSEIIVHPPRSKTSNDFAEGWSLSIHHHLNLQDTSILHKGDGTTTANNIRTVSRITGLGWGGYNGTNKSALDAAIKYPYDVTVDREGNVYFADSWNVRIRKVDTSGMITDIAGDGMWGFDGDGGPAENASFRQIYGVAVNNAGEIYIADTGNFRIRKIDQEGIISTIAGTGESGYSGDNGPATLARLYQPYDIALDGGGNLYIADTFNHRIRKVDPQGIITTIAGNGVYGFRGDNGPAVQASLWNPSDIAVHDDGTLYIADMSNHRIRKVDAQGIISTFAGSDMFGHEGDGGPADLARLRNPRGVAVDRAGNVYIADDTNSRIRQVSGNGIITTIAGNGIYQYGGSTTVPATQTSFRHPSSVAVDSDGSLYIADMTNHLIRKVSHPSAFSQAVLEGSTIFAEGPTQGHVMANTGIHLQTIDLDSGIPLYSFEYDTDGDLSAIIDKFGNRTFISRDENKRPVSITSPHGITTNLIIDEDNFLSGIVNPDGSRFIFEYDPQGLMTAKIEPVGNRFEHTFDGNGRVTLVADEAGGVWEYSRTIDGSGSIQVTVTTGEGNMTNYQDYTNSIGAYTSIITGPDNTETLFSRSADGISVEKIPSCGTQFNFQYDLDSEYNYPFIRESRETTPQGLERVSTGDTAYADTNGDKIPDIITRTFSRNDKVSTAVNDLNQSMIIKTSPAGRTTSIRYNAENLLVESVHADGLFDTNYQYDDLGRLTSIVSGNRETRYAYNNQGYVQSINNADNHATAFTYDAMGRPIRVERPDNSSVAFAYDDNGNLQWLSTPSAADHGFTYNTVNLKSGYLPPLSGNYQFLYDMDRRLSRVDFPSGARLNYSYDAGRLIQIQTPEKNIDFSYSCASKIDSITDGVNSIAFDYDGKLLLAEAQSGALNASIAYLYNSDYLPDQITYAGEMTDFLYDSDSLLIGAGQYTIFRNEDNGLPESVSGGSLALGRAFNGYGEIAEASFSISDQARLTWILERDNKGRIVQKRETIDGTTSIFDYGYDAMGRLLNVFENGVLTEEYGYGVNGWRTVEVNTRKGGDPRYFTYSAEDHLLTAGATTYQYNPDGFLTDKTDAGDTTQYQYSTRGELVSVHFSDGTLIEFIHDPLGRRIAKRVDGITTEKYLWQGRTRLLAVLDDQDNVVARFEYADGRVPLSMTRSGSTYFLLCDPAGSPRLVADDAGNVVKKIDYDAFGNIIADSNPGFEIWLGFAGGLHDRDINLVRFGHRDYDPQTGRWTAKDPIFFSGGDTDLYGYCLNDPVNWIDPLGLVNWEAVGKGGFAVVAGTTTAGLGALASSSGIGAVGGVPAVLGGIAAASWGMAQVITGFIDNEMPFMGAGEAIIKGSTEEGLLQDELLGVNSLGGMLFTGGTQASNIGKINTVIQSGYSFFSSVNQIKESIDSNCK